MKKVTSLLLALVMALALAVPAFAVDLAEGEVSGNKTQDVTAKYTAPKNDYGPKVYYFTVAWTKDSNSNLTYEGKNATYTWNGETMKYTEKINNANEKFGWDGSIKYTVNVANQSNDKVSVSTDASVKYNLTLTKPSTMTADLTTATVAVKDGKPITVENNNIGEIGTAQPASFEYTYAANTTASAPTDAAKDATTVTVGTITVTVTHA